ncbi:MAG: hypothetical protein ACK4LB_01940 [Spirosomataceae bacterium]
MIRIFIRNQHHEVLHTLALPHPLLNFANLPKGGYIEHIFPDGKTWTIRLLG